MSTPTDTSAPVAAEKDAMVTTDLAAEAPEEAVTAPESARAGGRHRAAKPRKEPRREARSEGREAREAKAPRARRSRKAAAPADEGSMVLDLSAPAAVDERASSTEDPASEAAPKASKRSSKGFVGALVMAVLTVAAAVTAYSLHTRTAHVNDLKAVNADAAAALAQAKHDVQDILSFDYRHLDDDINNATSETTGQLRNDYTSTAKKVLAAAPSIKAISQATVSDKSASVVHAQRGRVTVLLFVDQESIKTLKGQKSPTTRIDPVRVQMTMTKVNGRWLASDLKPV